MGRELADWEMMSIRLKIIFVVMPLLIATLVLTSIFSSSSAESGLTKVAIDFLYFKMEQLQKYTGNQWNLLVTNGLSTNEEFRGITQEAIQNNAKELTKSATEWVFALGPEGELLMSSREDLEWGEEQIASVEALLSRDVQGWVEFRLFDKQRVAQSFYFEPFQWKVLVSEETEAFFSGVNEIITTNLTILVSSVILGILILLFFTAYLTKPIKNMVSAMEKIIQSNDLSSRVDVEFKDEIGSMAQTFNIMLEELGGAYQQIKNFALQSVLAQKNEKKIRNIFQKYVPENVINEIFSNPESMLVGSNRQMAILFSDIRSFTTISESMAPDLLVESLNRYFDVMVEIIIQNYGIVDKYIGDAIMAFFGAPVASENDALLSVIAGIGMIDALDDFNAEQKSRGLEPFRIGVGINFGEVTVGNIGTEKKMDYTVIGDGVNLASRLEGMTKEFQQGLIFSDSVYQKVGRFLPCRLVGKIIVKGKTVGSNIYTARAELSPDETRGWALYHSGMESFYSKDFKKTQDFLKQAKALLGEDFLCNLYLDQSTSFIKNPPGDDWDGTIKMDHK